MYMNKKIYKARKNIYYIVLGSVSAFPIPTDFRLIGIAFIFFELIKWLFSSINLARDGTAEYERRIVVNIILIASYNSNENNQKRLETYYNVLHRIHQKYKNSF